MKQEYGKVIKQKKQVKWGEDGLLMRYKSLMSAAKEGDFEQFTNIMGGLDKEAANRCIKARDGILLKEFISGAYNTLKQGKYDSDKFIEASHSTLKINYIRSLGIFSAALWDIWRELGGGKENEFIKKLREDGNEANIKTKKHLAANKENNAIIGVSPGLIISGKDKPSMAIQQSNPQNTTAFADTTSHVQRLNQATATTQLDKRSGFTR
jgi:hypothetical protein